MQSKVWLYIKIVKIPAGRRRDFYYMRTVCLERYPDTTAPITVAVMLVEAEMIAPAPMPVITMNCDARTAGIADAILNMPAIALTVAGNES